MRIQLIQDSQLAHVDAMFQEWCQEVHDAVKEAESFFQFFEEVEINRKFNHYLFLLNNLDKLNGENVNNLKDELTFLSERSGKLIDACPNIWMKQMEDAVHKLNLLSQYHQQLISFKQYQLKSTEIEQDFQAIDTILRKFRSKSFQELQDKFNLLDQWRKNEGEKKPDEEQRKQLKKQIQHLSPKADPIIKSISQKKEKNIIRQKKEKNIKGDTSKIDSYYEKVHEDSVYRALRVINEKIVYEAETKFYPALNKIKKWDGALPILEKNSYLAQINKVKDLKELQALQEKLENGYKEWINPLNKLKHYSNSIDKQIKMVGKVVNGKIKFDKKLEAEFKVREAKEAAKKNAKDSKDPKELKATVDPDLSSVPFIPFSLRADFFLTYEYIDYMWERGIRLDVNFVNTLFSQSKNPLESKALPPKTSRADEKAKYIADEKPKNITDDEIIRLKSGLQLMQDYQSILEKIELRKKSLAPEERKSSTTILTTEQKRSSIDKKDQNSEQKFSPIREKGSASIDRIHETLRNTTSVSELLQESQRVFQQTEQFLQSLNETALNEMEIHRKLNHYLYLLNNFERIGILERTELENEIEAVVVGPMIPHQNYWMDQAKQIFEHKVLLIRYLQMLQMVKSTNGDNKDIIIEIQKLQKLQEKLPLNLCEKYDVLKKWVENEKKKPPILEQREALRKQIKKLAPTKGDSSILDAVKQLAPDREFSLNPYYQKVREDSINKSIDFAYDRITEEYPKFKHILSILSRPSRDQDLISKSADEIEKIEDIAQLQELQKRAERSLKKNSDWFDRLNEKCQLLTGQFLFFQELKSENEQRKKQRGELKAAEKDDFTNVEEVSARKIQRDVDFVHNLLSDVKSYSDEKLQDADITDELRRQIPNIKTKLEAVDQQTILLRCIEDRIAALRPKDSFELKDSDSKETLMELSEEIDPQDLELLMQISSDADSADKKDERVVFYSIEDVKSAHAASPIDTDTTTDAKRSSGEPKDPDKQPVKKVIKAIDVKSLGLAFDFADEKIPDTDSFALHDYKIVFSEATLQKAAAYKEQLEEKSVCVGNYFGTALEQSKKPIEELSIEEFIEILINTKKSSIYAESEVVGDGSDWNGQELSILGDINFVVPVSVFDNGVWENPTVHESSFEATLLFTPGALLRNDNHVITPDMQEVIHNIDSKDEKTERTIDDEKLYKLYERRLLPLFIEANNSVDEKGAFITLPGLGCGQFAGDFRGQLGDKLHAILIKMLDTHQDKLINIKGVYFDPFDECEDKMGVRKIGTIDFFVKPSEHAADKKSQLCHPREYGEQYASCRLFSVVAWDHVSWPGNDFIRGSRWTDDGAKAAATSSCQVLTGIKGEYDKVKFEFLPKDKKFATWEAVINRHKLTLKAKGKVFVLTDEGLQALDVKSHSDEEAQSAPDEGDSREADPDRSEGDGEPAVNDDSEEHRRSASVHDSVFADAEHESKEEAADVESLFPEDSHSLDDDVLNLLHPKAIEINQILSKTKAPRGGLEDEITAISHREKTKRALIAIKTGTAYRKSKSRITLERVDEEDSKEFQARDDSSGASSLVSDEKSKSHSHHTDSIPKGSAPESMPDDEVIDVKDQDSESKMGDLDGYPVEERDEAKEAFVRAGLVSAAAASTTKTSATNGGVSHSHTVPSPIGNASASHHYFSNPVARGLIELLPIFITSIVIKMSDLNKSTSYFETLVLLACAVQIIHSLYSKIPQHAWEQKFPGHLFPMPSPGMASDHKKSERSRVEREVSSVEHEDSRAEDEEVVPESI